MSEAIQALATRLKEAHDNSTSGNWGKGPSSHHTVTNGGPHKYANYRIAEFHHSDDAHFCDVAHEVTPALLAELDRLNSFLSTSVEPLELEPFMFMRVEQWDKVRNVDYSDPVHIPEVPGEYALYTKKQMQELQKKLVTSYGQLRYMARALEDADDRLRLAQAMLDSVEHNGEYQVVSKKITEDQHQLMVGAFNETRGIHFTQHLWSKLLAAVKPVKTACTLEQWRHMVLNRIRDYGKARFDQKGREAQKYLSELEHLLIQSPKPECSIPVSEIKQLCQDFSSRTGNVYIKDVEAALDALAEQYA